MSYEQSKGCASGKAALGAGEPPWTGHGAARPLQVQCDACSRRLGGEEAPLASGAFHPVSGRCGYREALWAAIATGGASAWGSPCFSSGATRPADITSLKASSTLRSTSITSSSGTSR